VAPKDMRLIHKLRPPWENCTNFLDSRQEPFMTLHRGREHPWSVAIGSSFALNSCFQHAEADLTRMPSFRG